MGFIHKTVSLFLQSNGIAERAELKLLKGFFKRKSSLDNTDFYFSLLDFGIHGWEI